MYIAPTPKKQEQQHLQDSTSHVEKKSPKTASVIPHSIAVDSQSIGTVGKYFSSFAVGTEQFVHIETDLFSADFTSRGGKLKKWELKKFTDWGKERLVQLIEDTRKGDLNVLFSTTEGKIINTSELYFSSNARNSLRTVASLQSNPTSETKNLDPMGSASLI